MEFDICRTDQGIGTVVSYSIGNSERDLVKKADGETLGEVDVKSQNIGTVVSYFTGVPKVDEDSCQIIVTS